MTTDPHQTPGFWRRYGPDLADYGMTVSVDLRRGPADLGEFTAAVERRFGDRAHVPPAEDPEQGDVRLAGVRRAIAVETTALLAFAGLATLSALLLIGQTWAARSSWSPPSTRRYAPWA
jgi:hypothetical protein